MQSITNLLLRFLLFLSALSNRSKFRQHQHRLSLVAVLHAKRLRCHILKQLHGFIRIGLRFSDSTKVAYKQLDGGSIVTGLLHIKTRVNPTECGWVFIHSITPGSLTFEPNVGLLLKYDLKHFIKRNLLTNCFLFQRFYKDKCNSTGCLI